MTGTAHRPIGLAQLSLLNTAPPELVGIAAQAGFDFIGARVRPVTPTERPYNLQPGSPMLRDTLSRMQDTGVTVRDIEFLLLDGSDQREAWLRMMEAGVSVELHSYPGTFHGSAVMTTATVSRRASEELMLALKRGLGL